MPAHRRLAVIPLLCSLALGATTHAAPADSLRHIEYAVTLAIDGKPLKATVKADITAMTSDGGASVELVEAATDRDASPLRTDIDRFGAISTPASAALSQEEIAVLNFLALESENIAGLEKGNEWSRDTVLPGGHESTKYSVVQTDNDRHVQLQVTRTLAFDGGASSSWHGRVDYDAHAIVPTSIVLAGRVREVAADQSLRTHDISLTIKLASDSFKG